MVDLSVLTAKLRDLAERIQKGSQALITATDAAMLPWEPDQLVEVASGSAR